MTDRRAAEKQTALAAKEAANETPPAVKGKSASAAAQTPSEAGPALAAEPDEAGLWLHRMLKATPSWLVSMVVHVVVLLVLAVLTIPASTRTGKS